MKRVVISAKEKREICDGEPKKELTEKELSSELIRILVKQGYDYRSDIVDENGLVDNLKAQLDELSRNGSRQERFTFSLEG